jgi:UDP-3-O-[3-hydroxymyristoyl] glucosamine N-acyltransferase
MQRLVQEIAAIVEGQIEGNAQKTIAGVADLQNAGPDHISFLAQTRYYKAALESQAGAILVDFKTEGDFKGTLIRVKNPSKAFSQVVALFAPTPINYSPGIHATAIVSPSAKVGKDAYVGPYVVIETDAEIGNNCKIGAGSYIGAQVKIGEESFLYPRVVIGERCAIGKRVRIHSGTVIGSDGFGYEFSNGKYEKIPQVGFVQIDDDVELGANVTIDRGRFDKTWIQEGVKIDNLVMIAHNVVVGKHSVIVAQSGISGSSQCGSYVTIAGQVGVAGHIKIGDRATVTAMSGVSKDIPVGEIYSGRHARPMKETMKAEACAHQLPELFKRVKQLEERIKELEGSAESVS